MGGKLSCASGANCASGKKSRAKKKRLSEELEEKRQTVDELRTKASELIPQISQHDGELIDQSIRMMERQCSELQASVEKQHRGYGALGGDLGDIRHEANHYLLWLNSQSSNLATEMRLGFAPTEAEIKLRAAKDLMEELDEKQVNLHIVRQKAEALLQDLPGPERISVEHLVAQVQARHNQVCEQVSSECAKLQAIHVQYVEFQHQVKKEKDWLHSHARMADKLDTVRLLASDVEKQADESKSLVAKVQNRISRWEPLEASGQMLREKCTEDGAIGISAALTELSEQHGGLVARLKQQEDHLRSCSESRRLYETDYQKIEHWCNDTDIKCMGDLPLDCATEVLEVQHKEFKSLANAAHVFESLVKETIERGRNFKRHLHDADLPILENQIDSLENRFSCTMKVIIERVESLEKTISSRQILQTSTESTAHWLDNLQAQIQAATIPSGSSVQDAEQSVQKFEDLEKTLADYQQTMTELSSNVEPLRAEGQVSQAEAILQLTSQYELLIDRVVISRKRFQAAVGVRQLHQKQLSELYTGLEKMQKEMASVSMLGLSIPERLQIYKELEEKLISLQPEVNVAEDQAQQIAVDCLPADKKVVFSQVETIKEEFSDLRSTLDKQIEHFQQLQLERESFEAAMNETISWLEEKEEILASLRPLHLDSDKVDPVLEKHRIMSGEAEMRISLIKAKATEELTRFQNLQEPVPEALSEKLQQIDALNQSIQEAVKKKNQYLHEAKADRQQLEASMHQVGDWLQGAEELLDSGYHGLDYSSIDQTLTEFSDFFSEASLCQDEMEQVSELSDKLFTTLDSNDTQTLQQSLSSVSKRFSHILASSQQKREQLEKKAAQWHNFQEKMQELASTLDKLETQWQEVDAATLTSAHDIAAHLKPLRTFSAMLEEERPVIGAVNEIARSLIRTANSESASTIDAVISSLNQRWNTVTSQTETKLSAFEELQSQWQEFSGSLCGAENMLQSVQDTFHSATLLVDTNAELVEQLDLLRTAKDDLETIRPQMERLRLSSATLQKALPSAEAKVTLEERFIKLQENYTRQQVFVEDTLSKKQEELDDRESFHKEVSQTQSWLSDTEFSLQTMDPEAADVAHNLEKIKIYQRELKVRMEQMRLQQAAQEAKYGAIGQELPQEMSQHMQEVFAVEKTVADALHQKEEELVHIHQDREEYEASLTAVTAWLQQASQQLQERIINLPETRTRHQELLSHFDEFKQNLDKLRTKGSDIIQHTSDQGEKHSVQKTIAVINRQWLSLQAQTADRTQELTEAADLAHAVDDVASSVYTWVTQAETALSSHLDWSDFDSVRDQLKSHRRLVKELDQNEDRLIALNAMVKQLDQVCDTTASMAAITALRQRVQQVSDSGATRLSMLEDANKKMEDYDKEIAELTRWMEETRTHMSMRDTTHDLKEQLAVQEHLLEDIRSNKVHTEMVVQQQSSMGISQGEALPSHGDRLLRDIWQLEETAERQCSQLRLAVTEQEQYDTELRHLHAAISEAQQQLLASPVRASSVEALKQQIAEHNSLASQIKTYQAKISEINEKSRQLSLRVAQSSTCVDRKRYLPEMIYRKWGSSASLDVGIDVQSAPVSSASHTMDSASFDSVLDGFTSSSQSQQTSPSLTVMTEYSSPVHSQKPLAVSGRSPGDATSVTFDAVHFKPIIEKSQMKSLAFQHTTTSSKLSTDVKKAASGVLTWQGLSGSAEPYSFKSASDSDISSFSLGKKSYLGAKRDDRSNHFGQVTIPRLTTDIPRLLSKQDHSATTSTPRREKRAWSTSVHTPGTGRRSFSYSPDKGRKLYQPPQMQSLSPALQSTADRGRGSGAVLVGAGGGGIYLGEASKLEGEIMQSTEPRARSASFGQRAEPLGLPLGSSPDTAQLNITWNSLQKQIAAKERELQMALQKQEKYQLAVQDLNAKMERTQIYLTRTPATSAADINMQMKEYREGVSELESIKEDIVRVQERGHQIMEISDPESQKAMEATLKMLSDRFSSLQTVADQRGKQLQDAVKHRNKHDIALSAYKKRVSDLEKWLTEMKIAHASSSLPTEEPSDLQQQLQDNRDLQDEITSYLQQISDLAVQCDNLCELEQPAEAEKLRSSLASLQSSLGNFKFTAIEKETVLRSSIREAIKRRREMEDYEKNVQKLQQWMIDTKQMTLSSEPSSGSGTLPGHLQLHQEIASDLSQHQQLVRQLSVTAPSQKGLEKLQRTAATEARQLEISSVSEEELHLRWEKLQRELAQKTKELENILQRKKSGDKIISPGQSVGDTSVQLEEVQGLVLQLTQCWQQLQVQVVDKQQRLDTVLSFQQQMQSAFGAISSWLDLAEQMVFTSKEAQSEHEQIRQNESLQRELRSLQSEIITLSSQAQSLLSGTSVQSHGLIQESLTSLTQRVGMLESQATAHSTELHQSQLQWQQYHEDVRSLRSSMQELQTSVVVPHTGSSANLDSLVSDVHKIESQLKKCENQLSELKAKERELSVRHPRGHMLSDLNTLHNNFLELQRKTKMKTYAIIDFKSGDKLETAIVPTVWLNHASKTCYWPNRPVPSRAVVDCIQPEKCWSIFPFVGIKYESNDYRKAAEKFKQLMNGFSDIASTSENEECLQRRRRLAPKKRHWSSSESDEEALGASTNERHSEELQLPKLSFVTKAPQLPVQVTASNAASQTSQETAVPVHQNVSNERTTQQVLKILEEMRANQEELKEKVNQVLHILKVNDDQHFGETTSEDFLFPLKTEEHLQRLEENLEDDEMRRRIVAERKGSLLLSVSVQEQYEKMLKDYAYFLETAEGKLGSESISARDLSHLKQQLSAHKEFFNDLEVHKAMLDSLAAQCDSSTQETHSLQHTRLSNLTYVLADKASLHGQRLDRAVRQWVELDSKLQHLKHFLEQVEEGIPKPIATGDSLATIQEKLVKFKRLQGQLGDERPAVFQAVDKGKQILHSVACTALETTLSELAEKWVELNAQLGQELKKTETIGEQLQIFEAEAMVLKAWMSTAKKKLDILQYLTEEDMQNIGNIRTKVEHVLEFRKEVQNQIPLKNKVLSVGRQLMENSNYDTRGLDVRLNSIEQEWSQLEQAVSTAEQSLHQAQMELMPSRQALHELQLWMEDIEKMLDNDANTPIKNIADIEVMLKKYKGHKVDLASKQLTVDFVNQAVLQPGPHEKDVPHEKLEFAEKLAEVNHHWQKVSSAISERLRSLEQLAGKWSEYEGALAQMHAWFRQQEDKLKQYRLIGHEVGVKQTLKDCKAMQEQLKARKEDMESIKRLGQSLIDLSKESAGCQRSVQHSLSAVWQQWEQLQQQTMQLENLLTDMLGQWARYHTDLHSLSQVLGQIEYTLNRYSLLGADIKALSNQVEKLKNLEAELKQHCSHLDSYTALASQLCQVCEPPVQAEVQSSVIDLKTRWSRLSADLSTRRAEFERSLAKWTEYEQEYRHISAWLEQKEQECSRLVTMREDVTAREECLNKSETLQQELDGIQTQLSNLYRLSDDLTKNMGTSTIVLLTSQQSGVEQRLLALRQLLLQHIQALHEDLSQGNRFREAFSAVTAFLDHAQLILSVEDPNKAAEQSAIQKRLDQLKQLSSQFQTKTAKLDEVNDLGYRLALGASDASRLIELNHTWYQRLATCQDRCKALQGHLLAQQDFTAKCETWMTFLASVEHDLSAEIAGNLNDLLEQQRKFQNFETDMYSKQQVLHAIISDGQKMLQAGEVEDPLEFERKLRLLSDQWQSVIRRSTQRKSIINTCIQNWHAFNSLAQQLHSWLAEKEAGLKVLNFDTVSLQQVRTLLDKVRTAQKEFSMQEDSFRKVHDLGSSLFQQADLSASQDIKQCAANLQNKWLQVYNQLEEHRVRLEVIQKDWQECEGDIEEILAWLKNIRSMLAADIPHTYDDLQSGLSKCKDITVSFANSEDKRQSLIARERNLSRFIQAEDMNVLHQRIRLLNKQWDELVSQAGFREQRLRDFTFHWSSLGQQIQALIRWINDMETKIVSSQESHVEDLLNKLEKDYQEAITEKGLEKEELLAKGRYLMKNSSEIRASDIEQRLQNLEDKWLHLLNAADFRRRKLHETVGAVRQLDSSMRNLTQWLASMEQELYAPVAYQDCDLHEIQRQLQNTQNLQHDVEQHAAGVSSVLNLCEVLLHDCDACPTQTELDALHHAMKNLDRRWKNICNLCPERRARIEETWHLWEDFQTDCKRFSLWLGDMETEVGDSEVVMPGSSVSKEEIHRYESLQTKVLDHLESLEHINKQYRRMAKEVRTDSNGVLKATMQEVNDRWDALQLRVRAIMQGMRQSASVREDFVTTRASLLKWLMEVDMQLTNLEHLSQLDIQTKLKELKRIEEEVDGRRHRIDYLNQAAALLIQQGTQQEAQQIQEEVNEFKTFSRNVLEHLVSCHLKLQQISSAQELQLRASEFGAHIALGAEPGTAAFDSRQLETYLESSPPHSPPHKRRAGVTSVQLPRASVPPIRRSCSPVRSLSPSHQSRSSPSQASKDVTDYGGERWQTARRERNAKIDVLMEQLVDALKDASAHLDEAEQQLQDYSPSVTDSTSNFNQHLIACEGLINTIQHLDRVLKIETGAINIPSADLQISRIFERWEQLQSLASESDWRMSQQQHELVKFHTDVEALLAWMDEAEALQSTHSHIPSDITDLNIVIRQHKDFMVQLEAKKAHVLSIRLLSKNFVNTTPEGRQLRTRLKELNQRWEALTASAARTQQALQGALLKCEEFHHTVHDYLVWMESMEERLQRCEPVRLSPDHSALWSKYMTLKELQRELEANQGEVLTLRETAEQLLVSGESPEMAAARDKTRIISNRLRTLLHLTTSYIESLETKLGVKSSSVDAREVRQPAAVHPTVRTRTRSPFAVLRRLLFGVPPISLPASDADSVNLTTESKDVIASHLTAHPRRRPLLQRVLCAALPLQVLLLLLLGVACLVPVCEDDSYTCLLSNNMRQSLTPMLHYTQGAPPT